MADGQGFDENVTVTMPAEMVDIIDGQLDYGDSRSAWIRRAIQERFAREGLDAATDAPADD
jgi:Arc/MetJ-type ribon-helix-helix transcriptional regulator